MLLWSLRHEVRQLDGLRVLHLNRINHLSPALCGVASLVETMYVAGVALGDSVDGYSNQDLTHLTFPTGSFDLVVHSETLEHVFEPEIALEEAHRVLKPGGRQIYTVPLLHRRTTRQRAVSGLGGEVQHLLAPSYHGLEGEDLVVWEFGRDFIRQRKRQISTIHYDNLYRNGTVFAIVERKAQEST
jgi:SAM-dependent methyltransferase